MVGCGTWPRTAVDTSTGAGEIGVRRVAKCVGFRDADLKSLVLILDGSGMMDESGCM